jgi:hypothetical protein
MRMVEKNERTKEQIRKRDEKRQNAIRSALAERQAILIEKTENYRHRSQSKQRKIKFHSSQAELKT